MNDPLRIEQPKVEARKDSLRSRIMYTAGTMGLFSLIGAGGAAVSQVLYITRNLFYAATISAAFAVLPAIVMGTMVKASMTDRVEVVLRVFYTLAAGVSLGALAGFVGRPGLDTGSASAIGFVVNLGVVLMLERISMITRIHEVLWSLFIIIYSWLYLNVLYLNQA